MENVGLLLDQCNLSLLINFVTYRHPRSSSSLLGGGAFFSEPVDLQSREGPKVTGIDFYDDGIRQERNKTRNKSSAKRGTPLPLETKESQIAPWPNEGSSILDTQDLISGSFLSDRPALSPRHRAQTGCAGDVGSPIDAMSQVENRRPSLASETTASSQTSLSKSSIHRGVAHKKITGLFGDDVRQSSRGSESSNFLQRQTTESSHQGSLRSNYTDGPPVSPTSSRPRTPLQPSSDVTPWLFQDFRVSNQSFWVNHTSIAI